MGVVGIGRLEAGDLGPGQMDPGRHGDDMRRDGAGITAAWQLWLLGGSCFLVLVAADIWMLAFRAPALWAAIETAITLCGLTTACLVGLSFGHRRHVRDLILFSALLALAVIDLVSGLLPAALSSRSTDALTAAPMIATLFAAIALFVGCRAERRRLIGSAGTALAVALGLSLLAAAAAEVGGLILQGKLLPPAGATGHGVAAALQYPLSATIAVAAAALLVGAAVRTVTAGRGAGASVSLLIAGGLIALAAVRLGDLVLPTPGPGWVTAPEMLTIVPYGLLLAAALRWETLVRRAIATAAASEERRRIARDLHDGLAQDLAFIAAHGERMARGSGEDHPVTIAARRALAVSRGAIADLSASEAPTAHGALRQVADELEIRFGVHVSVEADDAELSGVTRENIVRIAREAIVNAAHAHAHNIVVSLKRRGERFVLRVVDDGTGIGGELKSRPGFGVRAMRERARSLGGRLTARPASGGGTELEVMFP